MKVSDDQIREKELKVAVGDVTRAEACKQLKVSKPTYYRRLKVIRARDKVIKEVNESVTITIQELDSRAKKWLETVDKLLESKDEANMWNAIREMRQMLIGYRSALRPGVNIDNRQVNITVEIKDTIIQEFVNQIVLPWLQSGSRSVEDLEMEYKKEKLRWEAVK